MADNNRSTTRSAGPIADILVVDDTIENLRLLAEILTEAGYRVRPTESPQLALQSALAHPPGLILLDVRMPEMSGFELCRRLKQDERTRDIPIIFVSALQDVEDRVQGFEAGGVDFVSKPFREPEVLARVKTHLQLRAMQLHLEELVAERTAELEEANQALGKSEVKFRTVVEQATEAILVMQDRRRVYFNPAQLEISGFSAAEFESIPLLSLVHPDDSEIAERIYQDSISGQALGVHDIRIKTKSGEYKWVAIRGTSIEWEGRPAGMIFIEDISERKQAEETLRESEKRFRATFEQAAVGMVHSAPTGHVLRCNQRFCDILGYSYDEMLELTIQEITHDDDLEAVLVNARRLLAGEADTFSMEKRYFRRDNTSVWVNFTVSLLRQANGEPDYFVAVVEDISARKEAEATLQASEEKFRTLVTNTEEIVYMIARDGIFLLSEGRGLSRLGLEPGEVVGQSVFELFSGYPDMLDAMARSFNGETVTVELEIGDQYFRNWYTPHVDHAGEIIGLMGLSINITERKLAEMEVQAYQERLKALAAQLTLAEERERRRIAADLHDDVSQTLAYSRIQVATARKSTDKSRRDALLDEISQTLLQLIRTTRTLVFDLSSPLLNEIGLASAISEWTEKEVRERHGLDATVIDDGEEKPLSEDVRSLLFRNARELLTNVTRHANASTVAVRLWRDDETIHVSVEDDGDGMDPQAAIRKVRREGGFGLFSIQERMTDLGGSLEIVSAPDNGCTVTLIAPLALNEVTVQE